MATTDDTAPGLTTWQRAAKRTLDVSASVIGLLLLWWLIGAAWLVATIETRSNGLFVQERVGKDGKPFLTIKIKTMSAGTAGSTVTTRGDPRITRSGRFFRRTKIDELPQLWNVLIGKMSLVGPRPDVPGFADRLSGEDRLMLSIRPGITGPATLKYRDEEEILARVPDPERYNREVIFPDKVAINVDYVKNYSIATDLNLILRTISGR